MNSIVLNPKAASSPQLAAARARGDDKAMLRAAGTASAPIGMSFWTDAAILGEAGIPSILYGPTGGGLHGIDEWVNVQSVLKCRDSLVNLIRDWCR